MRKNLKALSMVVGMAVLLLGCSANNNKTDNKSEQTAVQNTGEQTQSFTQDIENDTTNYTDDVFLTDLGKGLMARWDDSNKGNSGVLGSEQYKSEFLKYINTELNYIEKYHDALFKDKDLQILAESYIGNLEKELSILDDYPNNNDFLNRFSDALDEREEILKQLLGNYNVPIDDEYSDIVAEFINPESNDVEQTQNEPNLLVVGSMASKSKDYIDLKVLLKNNLDVTICTPTINVSFLDGNGDIVDVIDLQAMVTVFPGQCIALSTYTELGNAESFVVEDEGWAQIAGEHYTTTIGGHLDPISLFSEAEEFEELGKSSINCIDQEVDNSINGNDLGISIEDIYIEESEGDYVECYAKIKNNTSSTIKTPTLHAALMDANGNIVDWTMMQESVSVNPDQSITLSCYTEVTDLEYFTVTYARYNVGEDSVSGYLKTIPKAAGR